MSVLFVRKDCCEVNKSRRVSAVDEIVATASRREQFAQLAQRCTVFVLLQAQYKPGRRK